MTPCDGGLICEANQLPGDHAVRSARDDPLTRTQRPPRENAIAFRMQNFDIASFDAEQIGVSRVVRVSFHDDKRRPQTTRSLGQRGRWQPVAIGLDGFIELQPNNLSVDHATGG